MRRAPAIALRLLPLLLAAGGCGAGSPAVPPPTPHPVRVMSVNQCTDQLVLALLPPDRIASVTWLSQAPGGSVLPAAAARVGSNHGRAEEVLAQRPDLVVAGSFTTPALRAMLTRIGYPLIELPPIDTVDDIRRTTRRLAAALDERARGEALIARMDRQIAALGDDRRPAIGVVAWDHSGFAAGDGSLFGAILAMAGARNLLGGAGYRRPDVEMLLAADPALIVEGSADPRAASLSDAAIHHPLVKRYWAARTLYVPQRYYVCGTPMIAEAASWLRHDLRAAMGRAGALPPLASVWR